MLRQVSIQTFTHAFESQNNPDDFSAYLKKAFSRQQLLQELRHPDTAFYFVRDGEDLVGYFKLNAHQAQTELQEAEGLEIERIYVLAGWQGRGVGARMLHWIRDTARTSGKAYLWLGVWEHNTRAMAFYRKQGFVTFGKHPYDIGTDRQWDWLMRLDLGGAT
nr:GNAT family N-acetyltransferase [Robiginitalea sp. SC105]